MIHEVFSMHSPIKKIACFTFFNRCFKQCLRIKNIFVRRNLLSFFREFSKTMYNLIMPYENTTFLIS